MRWRRWRLCDHTGRLLRGVGGVCGDWAAVVALAGEEDEAAAGEEPWCLEVQSESLTIIHPLTNFKMSLFTLLQTVIKVIFILSLFSSTLFFYNFFFYFRLIFEALMASASVFHSSVNVLMVKSVLCPTDVICALLQRVLSRPFNPVVGSWSG